jgi:hypothetical protein
MADTWAITPAVDDDMFRAAASIAGAGAVTLLTNTVAPNGCGYKIVITSSGNESARSFVITGVKVGDVNGRLTSETVTGPNATTASSVNFYTYLSSITISAASVGNVKFGTIGSLALPRCRVKGIWCVAAASAGSVKINADTSSGTLLLQMDVPAVASAADAFYFDVGDLLVANGASSVGAQCAVVTLTQVTLATLICG